MSLCSGLNKSYTDLRVSFRGGPFVKGLRRVIRDVQIGSLLIQSDNQTGEPLLFHTSLPHCVKSKEAAETTVLVMDAQISTGAAAIMAIRVLLDHQIKGGRQNNPRSRIIDLLVSVERNILFLTYLVAPQGLAAVHRAFPEIRIIAAAIGNDIREWTFSIPKSAAQEPQQQNAMQEVVPESENKLQAAFHRLQFNRRSSEEGTGVKKAYIVVPGEILRHSSGMRLTTSVDCGAFGDRYLGA